MVAVDPQRKQPPRSHATIKLHVWFCRLDYETPGGRKQIMGFAVFLSFSFVLVTRKLCEWWQKQVVAEATLHILQICSSTKKAYSSGLQGQQQANSASLVSLTSSWYSHLAFPARLALFIAVSWFPSSVTILLYFSGSMTHFHTISPFLVVCNLYSTQSTVLLRFSLKLQMSWEEALLFLTERFKGKGRAFYIISYDIYIIKKYLVEDAQAPAMVQKILITLEVSRLAGTVMRLFNVPLTIKKKVFLSKARTFCFRLKSCCGNT